jgi:glycosyltransferase involved in cell wall biosynthesis
VQVESQARDQEGEASKEKAQKMKVLGLTRTDTKNIAITTLRMLWPFRELAKAGHECRAIGELALKNLTNSGRENEILGYDVYVMQRLMHGKNVHQQGFFDALHSTGARVFFETDDDLLDNTRTGYEDWVKDTVSLCDAVTVSTEPLAERMMALGKPVYVCKNYLDTDWFGETSMKAKRELDGLVIGLVGTPSHWGDWALVVDAIKRIHAEYPEVHFACAGYYPPYLEDLDWIRVFASVPYPQYPMLMRQFDIVLCPLDWSDKFNHSKSDISALDAMAAKRPLGEGKFGGAIPVCQNVPVYQEAITDGRTGLLVDDWYAGMKELLGNRFLRQKIQQRGLQWVRMNRDIRDTANEWLSAYGGMK